MAAEPDDAEVTPETSGDLVEEMAAIPYEPLLPVEKTLIASSLVLGIALLGVLYWASATLFPVETTPAPRASAPPGR